MNERRSCIPCARARVVPRPHGRSSTFRAGRSRSRSRYERLHPRGPPRYLGSKAGGPPREWASSRSGRVPWRSNRRGSGGWRGDPRATGRTRRASKFSARPIASACGVIRLIHGASVSAGVALAFAAKQNAFLVGQNAFALWACAHDPRAIAFAGGVNGFTARAIVLCRGVERPAAGAGRLTRGAAVLATGANAIAQGQEMVTARVGASTRRAIVLSRCANAVAARVNTFCGRVERLAAGVFQLSLGAIAMGPPGPREPSSGHPA
jgi:hypothetical protein